MKIFVEAFKRWEEGYRANPEKYLTEEEMRNMDVNDISTDRAIYFTALIREIEQEEN